jgi:hypothetical protein
MALMDLRLRGDDIYQTNPDGPVNINTSEMKYTRTFLVLPLT